MPKIHNRSSPTLAPRMVTELVGSDELTMRGCVPKTRAMTSWAMTNNARVATILIRLEACLSWRISTK